MLLTKYIRNKNGHKRGVLIATEYDEVGFSLCNKKDKWNKEEGLRIAFDRATEGLDVQVPHSLKYEFACFEDRANRYFRKNK